MTRKDTLAMEHKCVIDKCGKPTKGLLTCCEEHAGESKEGCQ